MNFHLLEESKKPFPKNIPVPMVPPPPLDDLDEKPEIPNKEITFTAPEIRPQTIHFYPKIPTIILESKLLFNHAQNLEASLNFDLGLHNKANNEPVNLSVIEIGNEMKPKIIQSKEKTSHLTRKIVKNFGKAIASFACCSKAVTIINKVVKNNSQKKDSFINFVYDNKEFIEGNRRLMQLLTITSEDDKDTKRNKLIFKLLAEIFMKRYVQQWLWNSKLVNKELHSSLIKDMRRRIKHPELLEHLSE